MSKNVLYVKASTERLPEYKHYTLIIKDESQLYVQKKACGDTAIPHINNLINNREAIEKGILDHSVFETAPCQLVEKGIVEFPYYQGITLQEKLYYLSLEEYIAEVKKFRELLQQAMQCCIFKDSPEFHSLFGKCSIDEGTEAIRVGNLDMVFSNVFLEDDKYVLTDYEWVLPFPVPLDFIIFRGLLVDARFTALSREDKKKVSERLGITEELFNMFYQMEVEFQKHVCGEKHSLNKFDCSRIKSQNDSLSALLNYKRQYTALIASQHACKQVEKKGLFAAGKKAIKKLVRIVGH